MVVVVSIIVQIIIHIVHIALVVVVVVVSGHYCTILEHKLHTAIHYTTIHMALLVQCTLD